jgi:predicted nucleic-acid-binding Zn-ribbon protein
MKVDNYKVIVVPCKRCAMEFELRLPIDLYETMVAAAEGEQLEFTGTCPDCRADDPFLKLLDDAGIPTAGRDFTRCLK